jgi:hypothetical protein
MTLTLNLIYVQIIMSFTRCYGIPESGRPLVEAEPRGHRWVLSVMIPEFSPAWAGGFV